MNDGYRIALVVGAILVIVLVVIWASNSHSHWVQLCQDAGGHVVVHNNSTSYCVNNNGGIIGIEE